MSRTPKPKPSRPQSAAKPVARVLRNYILSLEENAWLGSEQDLLERCGCSRPTLRQAARLLEHQQLLVVKRGVGGGYYGRRPDLQAVVEAAALHLRLRGTTWREVLAAAHVVNTESVRLAALSDRPAERTALQHVAARLGDDVPALSPAVIHADERALFECVMAMSGNAPLEMFQRTLFTFGVGDANERLYHGHPERWPVWRRERRLLVEAILAGDAEMAVLLSRRQNTLIRDWLSDEPLDDGVFGDEAVG